MLLILQHGCTPKTDLITGAHVSELVNEFLMNQPAIHERLLFPKFTD
jgi:hypothetical protein